MIVKTGRYNLHKFDRAHPLVRQAVALIANSQLRYEEVARRAGYCRTLVTHWQKNRPQISSVDDALRVVGYRLAIVPIQGYQAGEPHLGAIEDAVAKEFFLPKVRLKSRSKAWDIVRSRQIVMLLAQEILGLIPQEIADLLKRERTTVVHGIEKIRKEIEASPELAARVESIRTRLIGGSHVA